MKKIIIGIMAIGLLSGCTAKEETQSVSKPAVQEKQDDKQIENQYIKTVIESSNAIIENTAALKSLLDKMNVNDLDWKNGVEEKVMSIRSVVNDYIGIEIKLSKEQKEKYKNTSTYFSEGVMYFDKLNSETNDALETYDTKALEGINLRVNQAALLIAKANKELETERYKE
jgi:hypothetical protein